MTPHRIHLRGPWTQEVRGDTLCLIRRFGAPARLDANEQVWLVLESITPGGMVTLNGTLLTGAVVSFAGDITRYLAIRNELRVQTTIEGTLGPVYLEFRPTEGKP